MATRDAPRTIADYEAFVKARPDGERWELVDGVIETMTDPLLNHGLVVGNIFAPLKLCLDRGPCRAVPGGLRVQMSDDRGAKSDFCRGLPTLQHIVFVYQGQMRVESYRRAPEGWISPC